ncbi:hypothetical protein PT974_07869 [Cladobotryum mycophilum]|uniref:Uncharacterized protein n=1 Tax=Cladobotryum mycophilum TaxID=491253 RepID=A0ABR0SCX1_9HYPO
MRDVLPTIQSVTATFEVLFLTRILNLLLSSAVYLGFNEVVWGRTTGYGYGFKPEFAPYRITECFPREPFNPFISGSLTSLPLHIHPNFEHTTINEDDRSITRFSRNRNLNNIWGGSDLGLRGFLSRCANKSRDRARWEGKALHKVA